MAKMQVKGLDRLMASIAVLSDRPEKLAKYALYGGAKAMTEAIVDGIDAMQEVEHHYVNVDAVINARPTEGWHDPPSNQKIDYGVTPQIKEALKENIGISKMQVNPDSVDVSIGFDGYVTFDGNQIPMAKIARAVDSGSSVRRPYPFFRHGVRGGTRRATAEIVERGEKYLNNFIKNRF